MLKKMKCTKLKLKIEKILESSLQKQSLKAGIKKKISIKIKPKKDHGAYENYWESTNYWFESKICYKLT